MSIFPELFSFEGRARRSKWWLTSIAVSFFGSVLLFAASRAISENAWTSFTGQDAKPAAIVILSLMVGALVVWVQTAVSVRRSHDRGQSGVGVMVYQLVGYGWSYIPMVLILVGFDLPTIPFGGAFLAAFAVIYVLCGLYFLVTLGFMDGEPIANAYGQSPKAMQIRNYAAPGLSD